MISPASIEAPRLLKSVVFADEARTTFVLEGTVNGAGSALYLFNALDADAQVEAGELTLLASLTATPATTTADLLFGP